jgi:DNA-directed RNA polymerase beta' subunit
VVERYIRDGDVVLVNRQPTLYKYSMLGNFIKVVPKKTIGLHMTETKMRQADFDGDEANIHVIQTLDGRVEAATFANVQGCIPDSLQNSAMIGQMQNSLSGAYMLTRNTVSNIEEIKNKYLNNEIDLIDYEAHKEVILTEKEFEEGLNYITNKTDFDSLQKRLNKHKVNPLSGKALFSGLLPMNFNYNHRGVIIKDGVLIQGVIKEDHIGKKGGAMHMSIWKWYGRKRAVDFVTDCTFLTDWFIYKHGLSIGFSDVSLPGNITKKIDAIIRKNVNDTKLKIASLPKITNDTSTMDKSFNEKKVLGYLDEFKKEVNKIGSEALSAVNPLNIMSDSGAKGNAGSTCNIVGLKGQETVFGERPVPKLNGGARCLPYFDYNSDHIAARGFISNSFIKGVTPSEMYFLSEGSRVGQLGTATTTAESGSLSHKLVKVLEDCKVAYDGSVRNAANNIYQLSYLDGYEVGESVSSSYPSTGEIVSFINLREAVERINNEY